MTHTVETDSWYLCHGPAFHYGFAASGSMIATRQESCELFASEAELAARIDEIRGSGWYEDNKPIDPDPVSNIT